MKVSLELGGKSPNVTFPDTRPDNDEASGLANEVSYGFEADV